MNHRNWRNAVVTLAAMVGLFLALFPAGVQAQGGGWEWQNPLPQGNTLWGVWGSSSEVFAVGWSGTVLHYDGVAWSTMSSGTTHRLNGVWGSSGSDVFAVGHGGTILHYNGAAWSPMSSGTSDDLYSVWGSSGTDVFAVGGYYPYGYTILHYDGAAWSAMSSGTPWMLCGAWGSSGSDVFAIGQNGTILHYDGAAWSPMNSGTLQHLYGVWGSSGSDVFAVGYNAVGETGTLLHYDGADWSTMSSSTGSPLYAVWGSNSSNVFAVGYAGATLHYDGTAWSAMSSSVSTGQLFGVWGSSGSDVFVVGDDGTILHYDGTAWSAMNSGSMAYFFGVWGSSSSDVFAVGSGGWDGNVLHYNGAIWSPMSSGTGQDLSGVWGSASSDVFAVGRFGTLLHYDGAAWSAMNGGVGQSLFGVWGSSGSDVFAVGEWGTLLHYDGASWSTMDSGTGYSLYGVWGSSGSDVFAVGDGGTILHYDGAAWSAICSGTSISLIDVWGSSGSDVFAVGRDWSGPGLIWHYDGVSWSLVNSGTGDQLHGVWGSSGRDVFAVGYPGTILHYTLAGVYLIPQSQSGSGGPGATVSYELTLANYTGAADNFTLTLGDHVWLTSLPMDSPVSLADGELATFTVQVTVPAEAEIFSSDTVVVTAASETNPAVYAEASLTTQAYAPPQMSLTPNRLTSSQDVNQVTTQKLTIRNAGFAPLEYALAGESSGDGDVPWLATDPSAGTVLSGGSVDVAVTFDATGLWPDTYAAQIVVQCNDPAAPMVTIPVDMTVLPTATMGWVEGTVTQAWTGNAVAATLAAGQPHTVETDPATGYYKLWLEEGSYTLQVMSPGYLPQTTEVSITAGQGTIQDFSLSVDAPPPVAGFWFTPYDPSTFDTVEFFDSSYDTSWVGIESWSWDLGDGTASTEQSPTHRYAADGDYTVQLTITTFDGRSAATSQDVPVRTHDVAIAKFSVPKVAKAGQTRLIVVGISNQWYAERVEVHLYKSTPEGDQWLGSTVQSVPVRPGQRTTDFGYAYTFTADDASAGTVTFKAVANIIDARDAQPADNEAAAPPTKVNR